MFEIGTVIKTKKIEARERASPIFKEKLEEALNLHMKEQWPDEEDRQENEIIIKENMQLSLRGEFVVKNTRVWIITSSDRKNTAILFPAEFTP